MGMENIKWHMYERGIVRAFDKINKTQSLGDIIRLLQKNGKKF
jgi:hypothetical protein